VCDEAGNSYSNPCVAFCAGVFKFAPCAIDNARAIDCPATATAMFDVAVEARLKNSQLRTVWASEDVYFGRYLTVAECAAECVGWGPSCHSFEHHTRSGKCELKGSDASEIQINSHDKWTNHMRIAYCTPAAEVRETEDLPERRPQTGGRK
jgi:hypothetical protein